MTPNTAVPEFTLMPATAPPCQASFHHRVMTSVDEQRLDLRGE